MKKKANQKSKVVGVAATKSRLQDASTQTDRYVEYMPLPIIVDIKSENESSDDEAVDTTIKPSIEVFESLKLEIDDSHQQFEEQEIVELPPVEQVYFEEKVNIETLQIAFNNENLVEIPLEPQINAPLPQHGGGIRRRKQPTETVAATVNGTKAKKPKNQQRDVNHKENKGKRKSKTSPLLLKLVECSLCKFTCKRPSHLKRHMLMHTGEKVHLKYNNKHLKSNQI